MKKIFLLSPVCVAAVFAVTCLTGCCTSRQSGGGSVSHEPFGQTTNGTLVELYTLKNAHGMEARIMTYGGIMQSLIVPDKDGNLGDIVLGYDTLDGYLTNSPYFGALIGRYGNRIGGGRFTLEGETYTLPQNDHGNTLHGGLKGFDKVVWKVVSAEVGPDGPQLTLNYLSPDGDQGFPGNLNVTATYTVTEDNSLKLQYTATTDKPTVVNLTHHSYFNLAGQGKGDVLGHIVYINADQTTPVDSKLITTGAFADVAGTPFDFRTPTTIGARINDPDPVLQYGPGYDHNWVIHKPMGEFGLMARVIAPSSGRIMEVWSDQPGLQFYAGNFLDGTIIGKGGKVYQHRGAFCMEPQHYPDSPNKPNFPSVELKPGESYENTIEYKFSVQK
jgi:aldose 1-epimerase